MTSNVPVAIPTTPGDQGFQPHRQRVIHFSKRKSVYMLVLATILIAVMSLSLLIPTAPKSLVVLGICSILILVYCSIKYLTIIFDNKYAICIDSTRIIFSSFYNYKEIPLNKIKSINYGILSLQANVPFITINTINDELYFNHTAIIRSLFKLDSYFLGGNITIRGDLLDIPLNEVYKCLNDYPNICKVGCTLTAQSRGTG